jgi:DNA helicase-2/ATP-dependent DNA helicase PcrA
VPPSPPPIRKGTGATPQKTPSQPVQKEAQFKPGDKVRHNVFGEGMVLKSEMVQNTEFVEVQFLGKVGKKRLSMDFAKLEKM